MPEMIGARRYCAKSPTMLEAADRHGEHAPDQRRDRERAVGGAEPAAFEMPHRHQRREIPGIGSLDDRQAEQQHRLQDGDDPAGGEAHPIEIGDLLRAEIEGAAEQSGKDEHPRHAEDVLQAEDQRLPHRQLLVEADLEDRRGGAAVRLRRASSGRLQGGHRHRSPRAVAPRRQDGPSFSTHARRRGFVSPVKPRQNSSCSLFCSFDKKAAYMGRGNMSRPLDRQTAALLLVGWLVALVTTLT